MLFGVSRTLGVLAQVISKHNPLINNQFLVNVSSKANPEVFLVNNIVAIFLHMTHVLQSQDLSDPIRSGWNASSLVELNWLNLSKIAHIQERYALGLRFHIQSRIPIKVVIPPSSK